MLHVMQRNPDAAPKLAFDEEESDIEVRIDALKEAADSLEWSLRNDSGQ